MTTIAIETAVENGDLGEIARTLRSVSFFYLLPAMGLLLLAPFVMMGGRLRRRFESAEWSFALTSFVVFGIGAVFWGLVVFGNTIDRTLLHICSYLLPILGMAGAVAGLRAVLPRFAVYYVGIASLLSLGLYAPVLDPPPGGYYLPVAIVIAGASLVGFVAVALLGDRRHKTPTSQQFPSDSDEDARAAQRGSAAANPVEI
jgi:hypothetical protein